MKNHDRVKGPEPKAEFITTATTSRQSSFALAPFANAAEILSMEQEGEASHINFMFAGDKKKLLPVHLYLSPTWSSDNLHYRSMLRRFLVNTFTPRRVLHATLGRSSVDTAPIEDWLNLELRPRHPQISISISHTSGMGGFAYCEKPFRIGIDIEKRKRLTPQIAARVGTPEDAHAAEPAHLWCAKEAAFKAASADFQVRVLSDLTVDHWEREGFGNVARFRAHLKSNPGACIGNGLIWTLPEHVLAIFTISPSTLVGTCRRDL